MVVVVQFDEIAEMTRSMHEETRARLANTLDIPVEVLPNYEECASAQAAHDENVSKMTVATLGVMIAQYREVYRLREDAPLVVSLGREVIRILEQRGKLLGGDAGAKRYVMVEEVKVEVEEDTWRTPGENIVRGCLDGINAGAKRQAPTTGPRRDTFGKRGKS